MKIGARIIAISRIAFMANFSSAFSTSFMSPPLLYTNNDLNVNVFFREKGDLASKKGRKTNENDGAQPFTQGSFCYMC